MTHHTTPDGIAYVRTPDERFVGLDDFPYEPKYGSVDGLRMAYIDEGPEDAHPVVLLHGEPELRMRAVAVEQDGRHELRVHQLDDAARGPAQFLSAAPAPARSRVR